MHGDALLKLLDQVAYACASRHAGRYCVTLSVDQVTFRQPMHVGELVTFLASVNRTGSSSMEVGARVVAQHIRRPVQRGRRRYLLNLFRTQPGDPLVSGYDAFVADISPLLLAHHGQTLRLRFAEVDNVSFSNLGVDRVSVEPLAGAVPEPSALSLLGLRLVGCAAGRRSTKRPASA